MSPDEITERFAGTSTTATFQALLGCDIDTASTLARSKWDILLPRFREARQLADLYRIFMALRALDVRIAIGTASPQVWALDIIRHHRLSGFFGPHDIVGGDMVSRGKPAPDIWQRAAADVDPASCLVVEDGIAGVEAARAAGMPACLLTPRGHDYASPISELADILAIMSGETFSR